MWVWIVNGVVLVAGVIFIVSTNHPMLYGLVVSLFVAGLAERAHDRLVPSWVAGYLDAEAVPAGLWFRAERRAVWPVLLLLVAFLSAGICFVGTLSAGITVNRFFLAFGPLIAVCIGYAVWMLWRVSRWVEVRLDAEGVSAGGPLRRAVTIPWSSVVSAFAPGQKLVLVTGSGPVQWPVRQLLSDPDVVAEIITRCAEQSRPDAATARAVIDGLIAEKRPLV